MPQLQHLEMACCSLSNVGLKAVLSSCKNLKHLDIRGCFYVDMEDPFVMEAKKTIKVFLEPVLGDDMIHFTDEDDDIDSDQFFEDAEYYDDMMPDDVSIDDIDYYGSDMMEDMPFYLDQTEYYAHFDGGRSL
ncbi:hypothetical protein KP509_02G023100 [Ceratopteris richardii]|nr:hypothetical protein KP509_02G023100 [Ceratopteris richardii]